MNIKQFFRKIKQLNVLILGDVMIDRYLWGAVNRVSGEAPVPVVDLRGWEDRPGGAANVALNIKALGANPILCSTIGDDEKGRLFLKLLQKNEIVTDGILSSDDRKTTIKTRVIAANQHLLRVDNEDKHALLIREEQRFKRLLLSMFEKHKIDVVIFQDYNKGVLTKKIITDVLSAAKNRDIPTAVDPKFNNFFAYQGATLFKPNLREVAAAMNKEILANQVSLREAGLYMREQLANEFLMITLSEKGLYLDTAESSRIIPTVSRSIADVCGAGDTVISVAALGLALQYDMETIARLANIAGGQVCEKVGVVPVNKDLLTEEMKNINQLTINN